MLQVNSSIITKTFLWIALMKSLIKLIFFCKEALVLKKQILKATEKNMAIIFMKMMISGKWSLLLRKVISIANKLFVTMTVIMVAMIAVTVKINGIQDK